MRYVGVHVEHGSYGEPSRAELVIDRGLKSGKLDVIELSEADLLDIIECAAKALRTLTKQRRP